MFRNYLFPEASKIDAGKKSRHASYIKVMSLFFGLMLGLGLTAQAFAQGGARGAIAGSVKDPSGAAINKAQVQASKNQTAQTSGRGQPTLMAVSMRRFCQSESIGSSSRQPVFQNWKRRMSRSR